MENTVKNIGIAEVKGRKDYDRLWSITDPTIWPQLLHFTTIENWGDYDKMDIRLLWDLDRIRDDLARPINIHCGYALSGHAKKSFHKLGMAVDFSIKESTIENFHQSYLYLLHAWQGGVGVYPYWNTPGFHLDLGPNRTWVRDKEGKYHGNSSEIYEIVKSFSEKNELSRV